MPRKMKMKPLAQPVEQEINARESAGPELQSTLAFPRAISVRTSTMFVVVLQTTAGWRKAPALA